MDGFDDRAATLLAEWDDLGLINPSKSASEELRPKLVAAMMWAYEIDRRKPPAASRSRGLKVTATERDKQIAELIRKRIAKRADSMVRLGSDNDLAYREMWAIEGLRDALAFVDSNPRRS